MTPDVERVDADLATLVDHVAGLVSGLSGAQLNFQPEHGTRWSIAQNVDHLAKANTAYLDAMEPALERARRLGRLRQADLAPGWGGRWFLRNLEPPPRKRVPAPRTIQPGSRFDVDGVLPPFAATIARARHLLAASADLDLNGTRFRNPFLGLLVVRASTGFLILAAHGRRHAWQARNVLDADGYPR